MRQSGVEEHWARASGADGMNKREEEMEAIAGCRR